ncbi:lipoate--protein ligase family protein [Virgibacillus sp. C22-A2]|uniref:Lipoate--protein ligase family protein n=1 Tax=Virgibacillus tibetensis TaxID=3042313 RepID=A0ABU6KGX3_9BACI|nr:lipoate--protein ligase family protein [Virgibacillus sp. C22-A2]
MTDEWGFLDTGFHDAATNMALDEALLNWHREGRIPPTLRFYRWSSPSLSVGHFQKTEGKIDLQALEAHNGQFVRRLTGGSAVLHDDELTYSIVISEQHPGIPRSIREAYHVLSRGILEGYKNLGIQATYAIPSGKPDKNETAVCFEKTAFYELTVDDKKISGNAQTRRNGVLLQHGSIPLHINDEMLFDLFIFPSEKIKQRKRKEFFQKASTINQLTGRPVPFDEVKTAFRKGFENGLDVTLQPISLTPDQWEEVYELASSKYAQPMQTGKIKEGIDG